MPEPCVADTPVRETRTPPLVARYIYVARLGQVLPRNPLLGGHRSHQRLEDLEPVGASQFRLGRALRVWHHAEHISSRTTDARNVVERSIRIRSRGDLPIGRGVPKDDAIVVLQLSQGRVVTKVISVHMANWDGEDFTLSAGAGEQRFGRFHTYADRLADVFQADIAHQRARQQPRFA